MSAADASGAATVGGRAAAASPSPDAGVERGAGAPVLGVIVPCRNEAPVVARKLRNLAAVRWPASRRPHAIVVVDDASDDGTAARAREAARACGLAAADPEGETRAARGGAARPHDGAPPVTFRLVANDARPGKAGAISTGLDALGEDADVVVLTDADVVLEPGALVALARAFADEPSLAMACGSQRFVRALADDGTARGPGGADPVGAAGRYDRLTARVRALESAAGRLFSVHGQLLAWCRGLDLRPAPGVAADDLDLMLQVRERGLPVRRVRDARFLEVKTPPGPAREVQALRRARAYVQLWSARPAPSVRGVLDRLQVLAYRTLPLAAPWLFPLVLVALVAAAGWTLGSVAGALAAAVVALGLLTPAGRHLVALLAVIARAVREERRAPLADRWETPRSAT